jgi:hypothetical protein
MNIGMFAGSYVIMSTIGDGINSLRVQMADPLPAAKSPSGWTDSETPPANYVAGTIYDYGYPDASSSLETSARLWMPYITNATCTSTSPVSFNCPQMPFSIISEDVNSVLIQYSGGQTARIYKTINCVSGYVKSGSSCVISTPSAVQYPSDGIPTVKPVNGVLTPNSHDPDNAGISSGNISRTGTDSYGNPVSESISSNPSNGVDYKRDTQSVNPSTGEPVVQRDQYSTNSHGQVNSSTSVVYNNSTVSNVNTSTTTAPAVDTSSLAKDATLTATNTKLDTIKTDLETTKPFTDTLPGTPRTIAASNVAVKAAFVSHLPTMTFSDSVPSCPTFSAQIPYLNFTMVIDQYCTMDSLIRPVLNVASLAAYTIVAFIIVLGA